MNEGNSFLDIEDVQFEHFALWYVKECFFVEIMKRDEYFHEISFLRQWEGDIININLN